MSVAERDAGVTCPGTVEPHETTTLAIPGAAVGNENVPKIIINNTRN